MKFLDFQGDFVGGTTRLNLINFIRFPLISIGFRVFAGFYESTGFICVCRVLCAAAFLSYDVAVFAV